MKYFDMLYMCYLSGQMSETQWQNHLHDQKFAAWVRRKLK